MPETETSVLVLPGGGAKGAIQAGAEEYLRKSEGHSWDAIVGTSVGALNGSMLATDQAEELKNIWFSLSEDKIHKGGPGFWRGLQLILGARRGVYDLTPLRGLLEDYLGDTTPEIPFRAGMVDLSTGEAGYNLTDSLVTNVWGSATMPLIWSPVQDHLVDGGLRNVAPVKEAMRLDADEIIVLLNSPLSVEAQDATDNHIWDDALRTLDILVNEIYREDIKHAKNINHFLLQTDGPLRGRDGRELEHIPIKVIEPDKPMGDTLDFSSETARELWHYGRDLAKGAINGAD